MPVADVALLDPLQMRTIAFPSKTYEDLEVSKLSDADLALCLARLLHIHFQLAELWHTANLTPAVLLVQFDAETLARSGEEFSLDAGEQKWEPVTVQSQFDFVMSAAGTIPLAPQPSSPADVEMWRRTLLKQVVQDAVTRAFGVGHTTVNVPRLHR